MVLEKDPVIFTQWIGWALLFYAGVIASLALLAVIVAFVVQAFRIGPLPAGDKLFRGIVRAFVDLAHTSPRRVGAMSWLAIQESLRRRVLVVLVVFFVLLLFAGWFIDTNTNDPARLYLNFVFDWTTWLVVPISLFLSCFSLPTDIKNRTITTIVTKPVRHGEIVLGRILGFSAIGTLMLVIMGVVSYVFVSRGVNHTHEVDLSTLATSTDKDTPDLKFGTTTKINGHRHQVTIDEKTGKGATDLQQRHWHDVTIEKRGDKQIALMSPPRGLLTARVPIYGDLRFYDRTGKAAKSGISVGAEWRYRSYIDGGTAAAAVWTFHDVTPDRFPDGLPVEMTLRVFRSYKGQIEEGINTSLVVRNPKDQNKSSELHVFPAKDNKIDQYTVPVELKDSHGTSINLFKDLVSDGDVEIWIRCEDAAQYLGVAKPDLYLHAKDADYTANFVKGFVGIWMQMVLVISFGVMFSTLVSGPVAMLATIAVVILGFFTQMVYDLWLKTTQGGGPVESLIRIVNQSNMTSEMEEGLTRTVVKQVDAIFLFFMQAMARLVPDFRNFYNGDYLAYGYNISHDVVLVQITTALGYVLAVFIVGYFFLRFREVSK